MILYIESNFPLSWRFCHTHLGLIAETGGKTECAKIKLLSWHVSWHKILMVKIYLDTQVIEDTEKMSR